ncbi:MAG: TRAP transporter large permease subunit [Thalassobaculaceae bacterium]|uniref:TRAP transporter large permease n=1 Tax=Roseitalea porphyridii TaxID=1852022 RepID=UPI0032F0508B
MDIATASIILAIGLLVLLAAGLWVAIALLIVGLAAMSMFSSAPAGAIMATTVWGSISTWTLTALPLFVWMGEILFRTRLSEDMFGGLAPWLTRLPGRLMHVNILGCAVFAAVSGSSAATAMTIGKMSVPELSQRGYDEKQIIGSLAGSATLGLLIPPSIILIVYGVAAEESIIRLFIAGIIPGILLAGMFMGYVAFWSMMNPEKVPAMSERYTLWQRVVASRRLLPVILLIGFVIGSIYAGLATATEAACLGVVGALALSALSRTLSWSTFVDSLIGATKTSCMICFILAGAAFLSTAMGFTGIPRGLAEWIRDMQLSPYALLAALTLFFIVLGCFLDGISVVVLTVAVILPMIEAAGIDKLWFGIYVVLVVEMSQITPPVGFNLFVIQGLTGRNILYVAKAALPFFLLMCVAVVLLIAFPDLVTWLPEVATARN